jgi:hypothetical protein
MRQVMEGQVTHVQLAAILMGLHVKTESVSEIAAAASVMREYSTKVDAAGRPHGPGAKAGPEADAEGCRGQDAGQGPPSARPPPAQGRIGGEVRLPGSGVRSGRRARRGPGSFTQGTPFSVRASSSPSGAPLVNGAPERLRNSRFSGVLDPKCRIGVGPAAEVESHLLTAQ